MPQLVFLADIHTQKDAISQSLKSTGVDIEGDYAVLLEVDAVDGYPITKSAGDYELALDIVCQHKPHSTDCDLVLSLMKESNNNVYAFDEEGDTYSVKRQNAQRNNIKAILKREDVENKALVVVIVGIAHLQNQKEVKGWKPLQSTAYPGIDSIKVGFPDGEDINSG